MKTSGPPEPPRTISFGPFVVDTTRGLLIRGGTPIDLRRKAWDVLSHLSAHPDTVVTTQELLDAVWPGTAVTPQTVTNVIHELRLALGDTTATPRWIQTVRGRGHVFRPTSTPVEADDAGPANGALPVVGRATERARLEALWAYAQRGESQLGLVSGEPGIGKTTLVEDLARRLQADGVWCARGACLEQHGNPEDCLPFLTALTDLATGPRLREVGAVLRHWAPAWLLRIPHLLRRDERLRIEPSLVGATSTRMVREGLALFRELTTLAPLVLVIEDLHWADSMTLDLLAALARTRAAPRLLVLATFRPVDAAIHEHPITARARELTRERHAVEIALAPFDVDDVAAYLQASLGDGALPDGVAVRLENLSAGNPLFLRALVDELIAGSAFERRAGAWVLAPGADRRLAELPESLRAFVASEIERLPPALRRVVEGASVVGTEALVPEVATTLALPMNDVAEACERLASIGRIFRRAGHGRWPDGTMVGRYAFPHASHRRIVCDGLATHDRRTLHRRLALGLEKAYGSTAPSIAAHLAGHFDRGGMRERAVAYLDLASSTAEARFAYGEAAAHLATALELLDATSGPTGDDSERAGDLSLRLGALLVLANGYSRPEVEHAYARALAIFERVQAPLGIFTAEMGLTVVDLTRARHVAGYARTRRLAEIAACHDPTLAPIASCWAGFALSALGELGRARTELESGVAHGGDPALPKNFSVARMLRSQLALVSTLQGDIALGRALSDEALTRSRDHGSASEIAHAQLLAAERALFLHDPHGTRITEAAIALAEVNGLASYLALLRIYDAALQDTWPVERRLSTIRHALADRARLGDLWHNGLLLGALAEIEIASGDVASAERHLDEAFAHLASSDERYFEAELCRLRAECVLARGADGARSDARTWLARALDVAARQGARLWELRAACRQRELAEGADVEGAAATLTRVLAGFDAGPMAPDVEHARHLLARIGA